MFDISWTEFLLIGVIALIVIGPKELPGVMRTLGQYTRKIRSMAADFQNQFQEAMREAEMADLKKQVDDVAADIKNYDPLKDVREDIQSIGKDIEQSPDPAAEPKAVPQEVAQEPVELKPETAAAPADVAAPALPEPGIVTPALPEPGAMAPPVAVPAPEPAGVAAEPASTERTG